MPSCLTEANDVRLKFPVENAIDCEIIVRKIPTDDKELIKEYGEDVKLNMISILVNKRYLKIHKSCQIMSKNTNTNKEEAEKMSNSIELFSNEMSEVLEKQIATV